MSTPEGKVRSLEDLQELLDTRRLEGASIAHCHGVFDLLHPGHFRHLASAKSLGDILVVTITADEYVGKGPGRPAFPHSLRAEALEGLEVVDYVAIVHESSALSAIKAVRAEYFVKGAEYREDNDDPTGMIRVERELIEELGGQVVFTDDIVFSSSTLINTFMPQHSAETTQWLNDIRDSVGVEKALEWLDAIASLHVVVVGETILDVYTECDTLGVASKEPVLCLNRKGSVAHPGGALAVARHCAGLGAQVTVITGINSRDEHSQELEQLRADGIQLKTVHTDPRPTIRKERILDSKTSSRVIELYDMNDSPLDGSALKALMDLIELRSVGDPVMLVADYGHGLLTDEVVNLLCSGSSFLAVNAQTNAGNHGFNSVRKYSRADFVTLNGHEARLESRRRHVDLASYIPELRTDLGAQAVLVTQGGSGLDLYLEDRQTVHAPALAPFVTDRVGAGDALLSVTALLTRLGAPPEVVGLLGNVVGAWAVSFLGNEESLDLGSLKRQVTSILK